MVLEQSRTTDTPVSTLSAFKSFLSGVSLAVNEVGGPINRDLVAKVREEMDIRSKRGKDMSGTEESWEMFNTKLIRIRPRFLGALGVYLTLSRLSKKDVLENEGLPLFRLMWFMGSAQDDLIDSVDPEEIKKSNDPKKLLTRTIFGKDRQFYQAVFTVIGKELASSSIPIEARTHLKKRMAQWYRFLTAQEVEVLSVENVNQYTFEYSRKYREDQNGNVGGVLVALLNGKNCLDPEMQKLEKIVPILSYRMQIIDDIGDLPEDIRDRRPSYAVGALTDHPEEFESIKKLIAEKKIGKITPEHMMEYAPESLKMILSQDAEYEKQLMEFAKEAQVEKSGKLLNWIGTKMFNNFHNVRDAVYAINPRWANF